MNIEQAKAIPLALILDKIGCRPAREKNHESIYLSPLRNEKTPSFHVNNQKNNWYDFGPGIGGNAVDFVCVYLQSRGEAHTASDALRWIRTMSGSTPHIVPVAVPDFSEQDKTLVLKKAKPIEHKSLIQYLHGRGISLELGKRYLKEVSVENRATKKSFFALGFRNEDGGYELRNPFFKGSIRPKTITFIRGKIGKPDSIHLFEGFMDYLSAIAHQKSDRFDGDTIVLNSLACLKHATPYIKNYGYRAAYTWMDNDDAGKKATNTLEEFFKTEEDLRHVPKNKLYEPHKDVNAWHMHTLGLSL